MGKKKRHAIAGLRAKPQQRPERAAMHHAEAVVVIRFKGQSVDVVAPGGRILTAVQMVCSGQVDHLPAEVRGFRRSSPRQHLARLAH